MDLEAFELVMLRRRADAPPYDESTLEGIQHEHLAYHASLRAAGHVVTNGPVLARRVSARADLLPDGLARGGAEAG